RRRGDGRRGPRLRDRGPLALLPRPRGRGPGRRGAGVRRRHSRRALGASDRPIPVSPAASLPGAADRAGRIPALRLPGRRDGAPPPRPEGSAARLLHPRARVFGGTAPPRAHLVHRGGGGGRATDRGAIRRRPLRTATAIGFLAGGKAPDYGTLLGRLRWRRAVGAAAQSEMRPGDSALSAFSAANRWTVVLDPASLPVGGRGRFPDIRPGASAAAVVVRAPLAGPGGGVAHTLRELEAGAESARVGEPEDAAGFPALAFRTADFPLAPGETVEEYLRRVARARERPASGSFLAWAPDDPSQRERPELSARFPRDVRRLVAVGCGSGATGAALNHRAPGLSVTGIERDPA